MAEVFPLDSEIGEGTSLKRMVSIRLHVAEEIPTVSEAGEVTTNLKRWLSTDALSVHSNSTAESTVKRLPPVSAKNPVMPNGISHSSSNRKNEKKGRGKIDVHNSEVSEIIVSTEASKKHVKVKKRWRIKRIFGIKN